MLVSKIGLESKIGHSCPKSKLESKIRHWCPKGFENLTTVSKIRPKSLKSDTSVQNKIGHKCPNSDNKIIALPLVTHLIKTSPIF